KQASEWLKGTGPNSDIVFSSRLRLARNLEKVPFPHWANKKQGAETLERIRKALTQNDYLKNSMFLRLSDVSPLDKQFLIERHLMSREHAIKPENKAILISPEEIVSIMVNEEDHLRIQIMKSGFDLREAWNIINNIDTTLSKKIRFAFSGEFGYLTACPTNVGTGMRGSVMLHLPALVMTKQINKVLAAIAKLSFTTRGLYGEGTQSAGNFFQISNQVSLGANEEEILENIKGIIRQVIEQENMARAALMKNNRNILEDRVFRSFGILKSAYIIDSAETIEMLSMLRLGQDLGIIKELDRTMINELLILTQPAHLQKIEGKKLSTQERDVKRAALIRSRIGK
ncbi:MAG TPA: protein arginine kinase, partial [Candidatus Omnitrophica bacterium]|nr:protein arginine kinase [Candidatus Omnitrophota bacterium]